MLRFSPCKINIGLDIIRRRLDGYHDIVTVMAPVPWHDIIEIVPSDSAQTTLTVLGRPVDCPPEKNLVMKAYRAVAGIAPLPPVHIVLEKIIPDGAGLGGGSADAATTILLLNDMMQLGLSKPEMAKIAATIGADCPFFIYSEPMLCTGTGTELTPISLDLSAYTMVLAKPQGVDISTKQAYAGVNPSEPCDCLADLIALPVNQWQGRIKNDFEESIFPLAPQIQAVKSHLISNGAIYSSMSGSGASVYGIFENRQLAQASFDALSAQGCDTFIW